MVTERVTGRPCFLVEHWLFGSSVYRFFPLYGVPGTLLGPEEAAASLRALTRTAWVLPARMRRRGPCPVRILRTAQWTRASSVICRSNLHAVVRFLRQVFKGIRWMSWHQEPMKDVGACDNPRGAGNRAVIRGFPNGETRLPSWAVASA